MSAFRPKKRFGQNFLRDQNIVERIMKAADPQPSDRYLEIGPGDGALTKRLLATGQPVLVIDIDKMLGADLKDSGYHNLDVVIGDALRLDWGTLLQNPPYKLIANLPYNISSQILFRVLEYRQLFSRLVLMFQKEVGERLEATSGSRDYGVLSVLMQTWFQIERVTTVPPRAFSPPPKVDSMVLCFEPLSETPVPLLDVELYRRLVRGAFAQRRKTLRNSLLGSGWSALPLDEALKRAAIDPKRRGETLSLTEFAQLANQLVTRDKGELS